MKRSVIPALLILFTLAACGNAEEGEDLSGSSSPSETTQNASPTVSASPSAEPDSQESEEPTAGSTGAETTTGQQAPSAESAAPEENVAPEPAPADDGQTTNLNEFLTSGGVCFSDYFPAGPPTESAIAEIQNHCATQTPEPNYGYLPGQDTESEMAECAALDPETSSSGAIQYCYMEYGIHPGGPAGEADGVGIPGP